jgi:hypothetical protein
MRLQRASGEWVFIFPYTGRAAIGLPVEKILIGYKLKENSEEEKFILPNGIFSFRNSFFIGCARPVGPGLLPAFFAGRNRRLSVRELRGGDGKVQDGFGMRRPAEKRRGQRT